MVFQSATSQTATARKYARTMLALRFAIFSMWLYTPNLLTRLAAIRNRIWN